MKRIVTFLTILVLITCWTAVAQTSAFAATLTPPPPGSNFVCHTTGFGTVCQGDLPLTGTNVDTGISCGTFEVLETFNATEHFEVYYNQAGLGTHGTFQATGSGVFINSVTGTTITANTHETLHQELAVPGDLSSATNTYTGSMNVSTAPGIGLVTHDAGKIVFDPFGMILFEGGPHPLVTNDPSAVQAICSALG